LTLRAEAAREAPRLEELVRLHVAQLLVFEDAGAYGDRYLEALVALGRGKEASVLARLRSHPEERFRGLLTVYRALSDANEKSRLLADVEAAARAIERSMRRLLALAELGALLARSGDANGSRLLGEAIELVDSLESRERRDGWLNVAKDLAGAGDPRAMEVFSRAVEASAGNAGLLYVLAKEISQPGLERAAPLVLEQAEQLSDPGRDYVLGWMLASYVDAKHFDAAEKILAMTRGPNERISALCRLASAVKRQDPERARTLLERAAAVKVRDTTNLVRSDELARMALVFDSIDRRRADELFAKSERAANDRRAPAFNREEARTNLIDHLTVAGRHERAASLARGIKHRLLRLQLSKFLPGALIDAGRLDDARAAAESIVQYVHKDDALAAVALALIGNGRLDEVERVVGSMTESADRRAPVLGALVEALAERGDLDRAAAVAASMPRCRSTEDTLASLAIRFARRGDPRAPELVTRAGEAAAAAQTLEAVDSHDAALLAVARALARSANCRAAADVARLIEGWDTKVAAYVDIATRAKTSDPDFAQALAADTVTLLDAPASESRMQGLHDISVAMQKDLVDLNIQRALERRKKVLAEKLAAAEAEAAERVVDAHVPGTDPMLALATLASRGVWSPYSTRRPTDAGVEIVARWTEDLERAEAGRGRRVLTRALDTAGWVRQDWAHVARLAAAARE
jgi:hypothetical protein